jgi:transaldolase
VSIFLDSSNIKEIEKYLKMGIIRGVTTNPTILLKDGVTGGAEGIRARSIEIARMIKPYPLFVEVTTNEKEGMLEEAKAMAAWEDNISVKLTVHGPEGELGSLEAAHELATKHNVSINITAVMSAQQGLLAALAGAAYVSLFGGRVNNMGYNACEEIRKLRNVLGLAGLTSQIIVGSTREVLNVIEWLEAGAHFVTVVPNLLEQMMIHPYTKETVKMFLADAKKSKQSPA